MEGSLLVPPAQLYLPCEPNDLTLNPLSNNVGGVKHFSSTLLHALGEERHFGLVGGLRCATWARF